MEEGNLVFASSDNSKEHFSEILTEMGVLDAATLAEVKASLLRGESLGKKLKERNIASPKNLAQALKQQITNIVDLVVTSAKGECLIQEGPLPPKVPKLKIQVLALLIRSITGSRASGFLSTLPKDHLITKERNFDEVLGQLHYPSSYLEFIQYFRDHDHLLATDITRRFGWDRHFTDGLIYIFKLLGVISFHAPAAAAGTDQALYNEGYESLFDLEVKEPGLPEMGSLEEFDDDTYSTPGLAEDTGHGLVDLSGISSVSSLNEDDAAPSSLSFEDEFDQETAAERRFREAANRMEAAPEDLFRNDLDPLASTPDLAIGAYRDDPGGSDLDELPPMPSDFEDEPQLEVPSEITEDSLEEPEPFNERDTIPRAPILIADLAMGHRTADDEIETVSDPHNEEREPESEFAGQQDEDFDPATTAPMGIVYPDPEDHEIIVPPAPKKSRLLLVAIPVLIVLILFLLYRQGYLDTSQSVAKPVDPISRPVTKDRKQHEIDRKAETAPPPAADEKGEAPTTTFDEPLTLTETAAVAPPTTKAEEVPAATNEAREVAVEQPRSAPAPLSAEGDLEGWALASIERFRAQGKPYSIAIMLACEQETVAKFIEANPGQEIYIFPREFNGRHCYDIAWGSFTTKAEAGRGLGSLPGNMTREGTPWVKQFPQYL